MANAIDPRIGTMPVKEILNALIAHVGDNKSRAASIMGISRQRMTHIASQGETAQELIDALENARRALKLSKSEFWDLLTQKKK